jgi:hypothetical protein
VFHLFVQLYQMGVAMKCVQRCLFGLVSSFFAFALLFALSSANPVFVIAQADPAGAAIQGKITDGNTKQPIQGVTVQVVGSRLGAVTDKQGAYKIAVRAAGRYELEARSIGYDARKTHRSCGSRTNCNSGF